MEKILEQQFFVTNPFNEKMAVEALQQQLSSKIFKELIQNEKYGLVLKFNLFIVEEEGEWNKLTANSN